MAVNVDESTQLSAEKENAMNYTILIYETPAEFALRKDPERMKTYWPEWPKYTKALIDAGIFVGGAGLEPPATGTTVRIRGGKRLVQDGPYAETKEQLGGYYIVNVPSLDVALDWAAKCPAAPLGSIEVRPNLDPAACS